jgi:hypothetical protein
LPPTMRQESVTSNFNTSPSRSHLRTQTSRPGFNAGKEPTQRPGESICQMWKGTGHFIRAAKTLAPEWPESWANRRRSSLRQTCMESCRSCENTAGIKDQKLQLGHNRNIQGQRKSRHGVNKHRPITIEQCTPVHSTLV